MLFSMCFVILLKAFNQVQPRRMCRCECNYKHKPAVLTEVRGSEGEKSGCQLICILSVREDEGRGGIAYCYAYTENGLLKSKSASDRTLLEYAYDSNQNLTSLTDSAGNVTRSDIFMTNRGTCWRSRAKLSGNCITMIL